jgi:hypothetical protein
MEHKTDVFRQTEFNGELSNEEVGVRKREYVKRIKDEKLIKELLKKPREKPRRCHACGKTNRGIYPECHVCRKRHCEERNNHVNPQAGFRFHYDAYLALICRACGTVVSPRKLVKGAHNGDNDFTEGRLKMALKEKEKYE